MSQKTKTTLDSVRTTIMQRAESRNLSLRDMSLYIGKNQAYMHQFIHRQSPKKLGYPEVVALAELLQLSPQDISHDLFRYPTSRPPAGPTAPANSDQVRGEGIPVYRDTEVIDPKKASEWTKPALMHETRPTFALWITEPRGRLFTGDLAFVRENQPPRVGDMVLVLCKDNFVKQIGNLIASDPRSARVQTETTAKTFLRTDHRILKIAAAQFG